VTAVLAGISILILGILMAYSHLALGGTISIRFQMESDGEAGLPGGLPWRRCQAGTAGGLMRRAVWGMPIAGILVAGPSRRGCSWAVKQSFSVCC
jgi:hypothetical protein